MLNNSEDPLDSWYNIIGVGILIAAGLLALVSVLGIWANSYWLLVLIGSLFFFGAGSYKGN